MSDLIEDVSSPSMQKEMNSLLELQNRIGWLRALTMLGASVSSFWFIYRVFASNGFLLAFLAFFALAFIYKFGASPMFAVAASFLHFKYAAVGIWLPLISYGVGAVLLYVDVRVDNLRRRLGP